MYGYRHDFPAAYVLLILLLRNSIGLTILYVHEDKLYPKPHGEGKVSNDEMLIIIFFSDYG